MSEMSEMPEMPSIPEMPEDVTQAISPFIFSGYISYPGIEFPAKCYLPPHPPHCTYTVTATTAPHMRMAACVCKKWREAFQKYVETNLRARTADIHRAAVSMALRLCKCDHYADGYMPNISTFTYHLYLDQQQVFSVTLTRQRVAHSANKHEFLAQYGGPEKPDRTSVWPVHTIKIPRSCWILRDFISDEQRVEYLAWRDTQLVTLPKWLEDQHAMLSQ